MEITVINNNPTGGSQVYCVDGNTVNPGSNHVMAGRSMEEYYYMMSKQDGHAVIISGKIEGIDKDPIICDMKNPADPAADTLNVTTAGFDLLTLAGGAAGVAPQMYMGVFDDLACTIPSTKGSLSTATVGTIDSGTGTHLIKVTPDATGDVHLKLTVTGACTVYCRAWPVGTSYVVDSSDIDSITFTVT